MTCITGSLPSFPVFGNKKCVLLCVDAAAATIAAAAIAAAATAAAATAAATAAAAAAATAAGAAATAAATTAVLERCRPGPTIVAQSEWPRLVAACKLLNSRTVRRTETATSGGSHRVVPPKRRV